MVTLSGHVEHFWQKSAAERAAGRVRGVRAITEEIEHAMHRSWHSTDHMDALAKGGEVHLTGRADSWYDRNRPAMTAWSATRTTSVVNDIRIN